MPPADVAVRDLLRGSRNRNEPVAELAKERGAASIDLVLVEDGIELGKKMMAEMIATYTPPTSAVVKPNLNEVSPITQAD